MMNQQQSQAPTFDSLDTVWAFLWDHLREGCESGKHPWHCGTLANRTDDGADARVVVLRRVDSSRATLAYHTDLRSAKCAPIANHPRVTWVFYDAPLGIQLRATGHAVFLPESERREAWLAIPDRCLKSYDTIHPPGTTIPEPGSGLPTTWDHGVASRALCMQTESRFGVVEVHLERIDVLALRSAGHRRVIFTRGDPPHGEWRGSWVVP